MKDLSRWLSTAIILALVTAYRNEIGNFILDTFDIPLRKSLDQNGPSLVSFFLVAVTLVASFLIFEHFSGKRIVWAVIIIAISVVSSEAIGEAFLRMTDYRSDYQWDLRVVGFLFTIFLFTGLFAVVIASISFLLDMEARKHIEQGDYDRIFNLAMFSRSVMPVGEHVLEAHRLHALTMLGRFNEIEESLARLKNAPQTHRTRATVQMSQWQMHYAQGNTQIALDHYRRLMKVIKFSEAPQGEAIEALIESGQPNQALSACKNLYKRDNSLATLAESEALAAWAYAAMDEREKMQNLIDSAVPRLEQAPAETAADVHYRVGKAFETVYDYQSAEKHYHLSRDAQSDGIRGIRAESALRRLAEMPRYEALQKT